MKYEVFIPKPSTKRRAATAELIISYADQEIRQPIDKFATLQFEVPDEYQWVNASNKGAVFFVKAEYTDIKGNKTEIQLVPSRLS